MRITHIMAKMSLRNKLTLVLFLENYEALQLNVGRRTRGRCTYCMHMYLLECI